MSAHDDATSTDAEQPQRDIVERLSYLIDHIDQHLNQDLADALADAFDEITRLRAQPSPRPDGLPGNWRARQIRYGAFELEVELPCINGLSAWFSVATFHAAEDPERLMTEGARLEAAIYARRIADYLRELQSLRAQPSPRERPTEMDREVYMLKAALRILRGAVKVGSAKEIGDALDLATDVICATYEPPMGSLPKSDPWHSRFEYKP